MNAIIIFCFKTGFNKILLISKILTIETLQTIKLFLFIHSYIFNNYSPKWRWLVVDIYRAAKRRGKYPTLATDTEVNSCFSIY